MVMNVVTLFFIVLYIEITKHTLSTMQLYKSIKIVKKTRSEHTCRGCDKDIPVNSSCIVTYEFLGIRYSNYYFHNAECLRNAAKMFIDRLQYTFDFLDNMIKKSNNKST